MKNYFESEMNQNLSQQKFQTFPHSLHYNLKVGRMHNQ